MIVLLSDEKFPKTKLSEFFWQVMRSRCHKFISERICMLVTCGSLSVGRRCLTDRTIPILKSYPTTNIDYSPVHLKGNTVHLPRKHIWVAMPSWLQPLLHLNVTLYPDRYFLLGFEMFAFLGIAGSGQSCTEIKMKRTTRRDCNLRV